jgi:hypothetical protein
MRKCVMTGTIGEKDDMEVVIRSHGDLLMD